LGISLNRVVPVPGAFTSLAKHKVRGTLVYLIQKSCNKFVVIPFPLKGVVNQKNKLIQACQVNGFAHDSQVVIVFYDHVKIERRHRVGFHLLIGKSDHEKIVWGVKIIRVFMHPGTEKIDKFAVLLHSDICIGNFPDNRKLFPVSFFGGKKIKINPEFILLLFCSGNKITVLCLIQE